MATPEITIPIDLLPGDGRFGSGPSKVRPEAVEAGTVKLVGSDENAIVTAVDGLIENRNRYEAMSRVHNPYGDGRASARIGDAIHSFFSEKSGRKTGSLQARVP